MGSTELISRQAALKAAECIAEHNCITPYSTIDSAVEHIERIIKGLPSAPLDILWCKDCVNRIDGRCRVANHHVTDFENCLTVFGAKRKETKAYI